MGARSSRPGSGAPASGPLCPLLSARGGLAGNPGLSLRGKRGRSCGEGALGRRRQGLGPQGGDRPGGRRPLLQARATRASRVGRLLRTPSRAAGGRLAAQPGCGLGLPRSRAHRPPGGSCWTLLAFCDTCPAASPRGPKSWVTRTAPAQLVSARGSGNRGRAGAARSPGRPHRRGGLLLNRASLRAARAPETPVRRASGGVGNRSSEQTARAFCL